MTDKCPSPRHLSTASDIADSIIRLINKAAQIEKEPVDVGHGIFLYTSEIHLIDMAGRYPQEGISQLAARLGVTKGAVSQIAKKLEIKGYIEKTSPEGDKKTVLLRLTTRGTDAFEWHKAYHDAMNCRMTENISQMHRCDLEALKQCFLYVESMFDNCPEVRKDVSPRLKKK